MGNQISKPVSLEKFIFLPDNVLVLLAQNYLNQKDGFALALSEVFGRRFSIFYGDLVDKSMKLSISGNFFLAPDHWDSFFQNHISPSCLKEFDASHFYWIPAELLIDSISLMVNLESLQVHDTQISLVHLPRLFEACQKIEKFSFSLAEKNVDALFQENYWMKTGFGKVQDLKIIAFNLENNFLSTDFWSTLFGVLKWCPSCLHLFIELAYDDEDDHYFDENYKRVRNFITFQVFYRRLEWMRSLKSFIFIKRGPNDSFILNSCIDSLTKVLWGTTPASSCEHFWIEGNQVRSPPQSITPLKSVISYTAALLNDPEFYNLQNVDGFEFSSFENLHDLNYFRGYCSSAQGLSEFCRFHPRLEYLHFDTAKYDDSYSIGDGNWELPNLKVVVYSCKSPDEDVIDHLIDACRNIEALHIGKKYRYVHSSKLNENLDFLGSIKFHNLSSFTMNGFDLMDGSYLSSIFQQCPKLEILHLGDKFDSSVFLFKLGDCLPKAINLRDLRLQWDHEEDQSAILLFMNKLMLGCEQLERIVLYNFHDEDEMSRGRSNIADWTNPTQFGDLLVSFARKRERLVLLCLSGFHFQPNAINDVNLRVEEEVIPDRSAFWLHLGPALPKANNPSVPRIHFDEIINPIDWFYAPPSF